MPPPTPADAPDESGTAAGSPVSLATVERQGSKLVVKGQGLTRFVHLPVECVHLSDDGETVTVVLAGEHAASVVIRLSPIDAASRAVIDQLPRGHAPDVVQRALDRGGAGAVSHPVGAANRPVEAGSLEFDGHVVAISIGDEHHCYLPNSADGPRLSGRSVAEGFAFVLEMEFSDRTRRRIGVVESDRRSAERALLFLRGGVSSTGSSTITWEYRVVKNMLATSFEEQLNTLGQQGWEVVAITGLDGVMTFTGNKLVAVLKRPRRRR